MLRATPMRAPRRPAGSRKRVKSTACGPAARGRGIARVGSGERRQQRRRVRDAARHRPRGVLRVRDRDDPGPAHEPDRGLDADDAAVRRRAHDRAVGLGADGERREVGRDRDARARARAARVAVERVGVAALAAAGAPARDRARGAEVRPLGHVGLAEDHGARVAQAPGDVRVARRHRARERERARRRGQPVRRVHVVLHQHRDAVERPARALGLALRVERARDRDGFRVGLDHGAELRPAPVERRDAGEVRLGDLLGAARAARHLLLQAGDASPRRARRGAPRSAAPLRPRSPASAPAPARAAAAEESPPFHLRLLAAARRGLRQSLARLAGVVGRATRCGAPPSPTTSRVPVGTKLSSPASRESSRTTPPCVKSRWRPGPSESTNDSTRARSASNDSPPGAVKSEKRARTSRSLGPERLPRPPLELAEAHLAQPRVLSRLAPGETRRAQRPIEVRRPDGVEGLAREAGPQRRGLPLALLGERHVRPAREHPVAARGGFAVADEPQLAGSGSRARRESSGSLHDGGEDKDNGQRNNEQRTTETWGAPKPPPRPPA